MLLSTIFCILLRGSIAALPREEFKSILGFFNYTRSTDLDDPAYRLRDDVYPIEMYIDLDVYLNEGRFSGLVKLDVEVRQNRLTQIVFHQKVVSISGVSVINSKNTPVGLKFPDPFTTDSHYEHLLINFAQPIDAGFYSITVRYEGQINQNPIDKGFYAGYYYLNDEKRIYATTQLEPFHARKAFPCFDEPKFKSRYIISITRDSNLSPSYSNMAISNTTVVNGRVRETFYPTPNMSAYLVAFHVSDFVETRHTSTDAKPFGIISRQGVTDQHKYAAVIGLKITNELEDYFGIQYHKMAPGTLMKNDHIALPDFPAGGMENWGIVSYREVFLLYDPENTNLGNKMMIITTMAHELGHKWFGNLVTCFWWSNLWLNESFASFFEYFAAHWADPSLELDDQFIINYVHNALNADSSPGATPMNWTFVDSNPSVSAHFSTTSYAKGASVLKMLEHFVGWRTFRNALRYYLRDNAFDIGTPSHMYAAFERAVSEDYEYIRDFSNFNISRVFDSWVQNPGAPLIHVKVNMDTGAIKVKQRRYVRSGTPPNQLWQIPLTWTSKDRINFNNTRPSTVFTTESTTIQGTPGHNWVIFNIAQSGYYRVNYDDQNWEMIASYLKGNNRENIHKLNRAQIVNDILHFVRSNDINRTLAFNVLDFLRYETDYCVWAGALDRIDWIHRRLKHLSDAHTAFTRYILDLMRNVIHHLGYEERATDSTSRILNRMQIMKYACDLGHSGCISDSLARWRRFRENDTQLVPVNLRHYVYCTGLREGDASDYVFLFSKYNTSANPADMVVMLRALACTKDVISLNHYLEQSMYNDRIRIHDRTTAFKSALQGNPENLPVVLNFLYNRYQEIRTTYGGLGRLDTCIKTLDKYLLDVAIIDQFQDWLSYNELVLAASSYSTGVEVVNTADYNLDWGNNAAPELYNFFLARSASSTFVASSILLLAAMLLQMLH